MTFTCSYYRHIPQCMATRQCQNYFCLNFEQYVNFKPIKLFLIIISLEKCIYALV